MKVKKPFIDVPTLTVIIISALFLIIVISAVIINSISENEPNESVTTTEQTVNFPEINSGILDRDYTMSYDDETSDKNYVKDGNELIYLSVSYPVFKEGSEGNYVKINSEIEKYVLSKLKLNPEDISQAELDYQNSLNNAEGFIPYEFIADVQGVYIKGQFVSILFVFSKSTGLMEPEYIYQTFNFDIRTGEAVDFSQLIGTSTEDAKNYIINIFSQEINNHQNIYYDYALEEIKSNVDLKNYYLTDKGVTVFFNSDTALSPAIYGITTLTIPYEKLFQ